MVSLETGSASPNKYSLGGAHSNSMMLIHKTNFELNPGVGDYSVAKAGLEMRNKSPVATIGNQQRFQRMSAISRFKLGIPHTYI